MIAPGRPKRVLLVEDSADDALLIEETMAVASPGTTVEHVGSLRTALERVGGADRTTCVLLDLGLPDADGTEGVVALRARLPQAAIVVLTGRSDRETALTAIAAGADDHLPKDELSPVILERVIAHSLERRRSEGARRAAEDRYRRIVELAAEGVWALDAAGRTEVVNPRMAELLGAPAEELHGRHLSEFAFAGEGVRLEHVLRSERRGDVRLRRWDGSEVWGRVATAPLDAEGPDGPAGVLAMVTDVSVQRRVEEQLTHQALHDALTETANRTLLDDRIRTAAARSVRRGTLIGLLFIDLDDFKSLNDRLGHSGGDAALREVARRLEETVRAGDTVARFGGDEFVVLCEGLADAEEAELVASRVHAALSAPLPELLRGTQGLSASVGIVVSGGGDADGERLLLDADTAMYAAKQLGRGATQRFDASLREQAHERRTLEAALRAAITAGELVLHYQPVVDLASGAVRGVEALVRWERPGHGLVPPGTFIPLAEACGLIVEIGEWTMCEALRQAAAWRAELGDAAPLPISVNLSAQEIADPGLPAAVRRRIEAAGAQPGDLALEITESSLLEQGPEPDRIVRELRDAGAAILLDDFGTGYSSLSYLHRLPIDVLKVDRSFVAGLEDDAGTEVAIVRAVVGMAQAMGIAVIVEGVETPAQAQKVAELGGDAAQGYWFAKPAPADALSVLALESELLAERWTSAMRDVAPLPVELSPLG